MSDQDFDKKLENQTETIMNGMEKLLSLQKQEILEKMETRIGQSEAKLIECIASKEELSNLEVRVAHSNLNNLFLCNIYTMEITN